MQRTYQTWVEFAVVMCGSPNMGWVCCCYMWITKHGLRLLLFYVGHQTWVEFAVVICGSPNMGWDCCCFMWVTKHGLSLLLFYVGHQTWVEFAVAVCGSPNMGWVCCWFFSFLRAERYFSGYSDWFSPLLKTQISPIAVLDEELFRGYVTTR